MPVNLSIKNVPDEIAERIRLRARRNHRSMQGEVMAILESASETAADAGMTRGMGEAVGTYRSEARRKLTVEEVVEKVRKLGLTSRDETTQMVREDRDQR